MRESVRRPTGKVRLHRAAQIVKTGRAVGKSTSLAYMPNGLPLGWTPATGFVANAVLNEWGTIVSKLLLKQGLKFGIGGMYVEFANVASPGDPVAVPAFGREPENGVEYYNSLAFTSDLDYLRVPLIAGTLDTSDADQFPGGNLARFFAQTSGTVGVHGKTFSDAANSTVYGGALVAFVAEDDPTQDLVFSRFYLDEASQQVKLATSQIGVEWPVTLD